MTKGEYELGGLSRGGSLCNPDAQIQLLTALRSKDFRSFKRLINSDNVNVNHCYDYPDYKTCLDVACSQTGCAEFVKLLLRHKADVNKVNESHRKAPIHFAAETGDVDTMKALLHDANLEINALSKGNTALHLAIKHIEDIDDDRESFLSKYEEIVELLLKAGQDANIPDQKNITPVYSAAKQGLEKIVQLMIEYSKKPLDLDSYKDRRQKTARHMIEQAFPYLLDRLPSRESHKEVIDVHKLFSHLSGHDEESFVRDFAKLKKQGDISTILSDNNGLYTLLQLSCSSGLDQAVAVLLEYGADPNLVAPGNSMAPIALACCGGYHKVLRLLLANEATSFDSVKHGESLLQLVIKEEKHDKVDSACNYGECLNALLETSKANTDVNFLDIKDNTALHYATRSGNQETVFALLKRGACIGLKNRFNEPPLADINAKTLERFLDSCLTTNSERPNDEDYEIQFDYSFLVPPSNNSDGETCKVPLMDDSNIPLSANDRFLAPETDALLYMTQHSELKPLLKHPVITSFLYLKWQRISCLFYANITFYALFWLSLILYIILGYGSPPEQTDTAKFISYITQVLSIMGLCVLIMREVMQIVVSPKQYFTSIVNWIEICLIIFTAIICFDDSIGEHSKQQVAAVTILLSSAELILLVGQFPALSTNIVMLKTVSWNFFKFLLWYCILIIAFALSFYSLFRVAAPKEETNEEATPFDPNKKDEEEEKNFFLEPGTSLFKTIVMMTGELEAGDIDFDAFPITSHLIFVVFVFMIPIVLFNLLNGLAVSDTQAIKENAELVGHISRIQLISYFENLILGDLSLYRNAVTTMQNACCWLPGRTCLRPRLICIKPLARRICLFPNFLPVAQIGVKTNQSGKVEIRTTDRLKKKQEKDGDDPKVALCCLSNWNNLFMEKNIVKAAKLVIAERDDGPNDLKAMQQQLASCIKKLENYEKILEQIHEHIKK